MNYKKETINSIKYFLKHEEEKHKFGEWDKFKLSWIRIKANGDYSFCVKWMNVVNGKYEDFEVNGSLNNYPIQCVLDGLDVAQLIMYPIHLKAYKREIEYMEHELRSLENNKDYLIKVCRIKDDEIKKMKGDVKYEKRIFFR